MPRKRVVRLGIRDWRTSLGTVNGGEVACCVHCHFVNSTTFLCGLRKGAPFLIFAVGILHRIHLDEAATPSMLGVACGLALRCILWRRDVLRRMRQTADRMCRTRGAPLLTTQVPRSGSPL